MNKLFTRIATLSIGLAMAVGVGIATVSGREATLARADLSASEGTAELSANSTTLSSNTMTDNKGGVWSYSYNGSSTNYTTTYLQVGSNSKASKHMTITSDSFSGYVIDSISATVGAKASTGAYLYISIGENLAYTSEELTNNVSSGTKAGDTYSYTNTNEYSGDIEIRIEKSSSTNGALYLLGATVTYHIDESDVVLITTLGIDTTHPLYEGQSWTPTITYNSGGTAPTTATSELSVVSGGDYIIINGGTVTAKTGIVSSDPVQAVIRAHATDVENSSVYSNNCTLTISAASVVSVEVTTNPTKTSYVEGQTLDLSGMVLTVTWNHTGTTTIENNYVSAGVTTNPSLSTQLNTSQNNTEVLVSYGGVTTASTKGFNITVEAKAVINNGLSWTGMKTVYQDGDKLVADGNLTIQWNDGTTDENVSVATLYSEGKVFFKVGGVNATPGTTVISRANHNGKNVNIYYGSYSGKTTSTKIAVTPQLENYSEGAFYKVTSNPTSWEGSYLIAYSNKVFNGLSGATKYEEATIHNATNRIEYDDSFAIVLIEAVEDDYSLYIVGGDNNTGKYLSGTSGSNVMNFNDAASANTISWNSTSSAVSIVSNTSTLCWNNTGSGQMFRYYKSSTSIGSDKDYKYVDLYKWVSNADKVQEFIDNYMKFDDDDFDSTDYVGLCDAGGNNSPYKQAKAAFNNLTAAQRALFIDQSDEGETYHDAYLRLYWWATANGESLNGSNQLAASNNVLGFVIESDNNSAMIVIIAILTGVAAVGGYFFIRRRKHQ